jgi:hypothetical protein
MFAPLWMTPAGFREGCLFFGALRAAKRGNYRISSVLDGANLQIFFGSRTARVCLSIAQEGIPRKFGGLSDLDAPPIVKYHSACISSFIPLL